MKTDAFKRLERARAILIQTQPFFGVLALHLTIVERPDVETAATDGTHFFYNAAFIDSLSDAELQWLWAHEVAHCAYSHHARIGNRDLGEFNVAADLAINRDLDALRIGKRPADMWEPDAQYTGMGAEEIYSARRAAKRKEKASQAGQGDSGQSGQSGAGASQPGAGAPQSGAGQSAGAPQSGQASQSPGAGAGEAQGAAGQSGAPDASPGAGGRPSGTGAASPGAGQSGAAGQAQGGRETFGIGGIMKPAGGEAAATESADKWQVLTRQAAGIAKAANAGTMPGHIERIVQEISAPAVDYRELLADLINSRISQDYSFLKPNRRFIGQGFYLPGIIADAIDHLIFAVDTSGSIDAHMLANASGEIVGAMESGKVRKLTVIFADAAVKAVQEFELGEEIVLRPAGGGGTRFDDTFRWIEANAPDATAIVYLTDMETRHWGEEPAAPVYWAVHGDSRKFAKLAAAAPFGDAVYIGRLD